MKRFFTLFVSLMVLFGLTGIMPVSAAGAYTITIKNALEDQDYTIYQIFGHGANATDTNADYVIPSGNTGAEWEAFYASDAFTDQFTLNSAGDKVLAYNGYPERVTDVEVTSLLNALTEANVTATATATASSDTSSVVFDNLEAGYYIIVSPKGLTPISVDVSEDVTVEEKNSDPVVEKTVSVTDAGGMMYDASTAPVVLGKDYDYMVKITNFQFIKDAVIVDTYDADNMDFKSFSHIESTQGALVEDTDYTVDTSTDGIIRIEFTEDYLTGLGSSEEEFYVYYTLTVTNSVIPLSDEYTNKVVLEYNTNKVTEEVSVQLFVPNIVLHKTDQYGDDLAGAKFSIEDETGNTLTFTVDGTTIMFDEDGDTTEFVTPDDGILTFWGLEDGTYNIVELEAPDGYNMLEDPVEVTLDTSNSFILVQVNGETVKEVVIKNSNGFVLPSTGVYGMYLSYIIGLSVFGLAMLLIIRKSNAEAR